MSFVIKDNIISIEINEKINNLNLEDLIELYCLIKTIIKLEKEVGNGLDKIWIQVSYREAMLVHEYLNIFKLAQKGNFADFVEYFTTMDKKYNKQENDTKIELNEYITNKEFFSQKIIIKMIFNITNTIELINKKKKILKLEKEYFEEVYEEMKVKV